MKQSKKLLLLTLAAVLALTFGMAAVANAKMVKKVDNFIFFVDQSGSMAMKHGEMGKEKLSMALDTADAMAKAIPELGYASGVFLFAPFKAQCAPKAFSKSGTQTALDAVPTDYEIFNRTTALGNGLMDIDPVISGFAGKTALIIFTDGNSNIGADPIAQAKALYAKHGDSLCIHIVSYADTPRGQMIIDEIRALSSCTVIADGASLMAPGAMDAYAKSVFYEEVADAPAPVIPMAKETITFSLHFGFDKYEITDEMIPVLEQAKMILEEDANASYEIAGHTDSTGTEAYNQGLSERRAASVQNWLVANGVPASRLEAKGYGELNPKYDNTTKEGRKLNRRVEILTK